jgi:hypothetical protein
MKIALPKYDYILFTLLITGWIIWTPYPFQKGGVADSMFFCIAGFVLFQSWLVTFLYPSFIKTERWRLGIVFGFLSLVITSFMLMPKIELLWGGDYERFFWEARDRIIINAIFYGLNILLVYVLCRMYLSLRGRL